jgi:thioredoxin
MTRIAWVAERILKARFIKWSGFYLGSMMRSFFAMILVTLIGFSIGCNHDEKYNTYVVYDFWATWCGPCRSFSPIFEQWEKKYTRDNVTFKRVNVDEEKAMVSKFGISAIPTVIVTGDGKIIGRFTGEEIREDKISSLLR